MAFLAVLLALFFFDLGPRFFLRRRREDDESFSEFDDEELECEDEQEDAGSCNR